MQRSDPQAPRFCRESRAAYGAALFLVVTSISGCSQVPDYANPVEWYNSAVGAFDEEAKPETAANAEEVPGADEPFPNLAAAPEPPSHEVKLSELETVTEGLVADREHARYTDEALGPSSEEPETLLQPAPIAAVSPPVANAPVTAAKVPLPALEPAPAPQPQPAVVQAAPAPPPQPVVVQPAPAVQPARVAAAPPVTSNVNVGALFNEMFTASGPKAVAPASGANPPGTITAPSRTTSSVAAVADARAVLPVTDASTAPVHGTRLGGAPGRSLRAAVIVFARGSSKLSDDARNALRKVAKLHKTRGGTVRVVGHASSRTKEVSIERHKWINFSISFDRAQAVAKALIRLGVEPDAMFVTAVSDNDPVYYEWMPSGEEGNRRAEVYLDF